jgi:nicotinate-nucleotide--dimethylbenzimidazole phosphoribosyltransferase
MLLDTDSRRAIASVAGFEIVAMAGFFAEGAKHNAVLLLDGYVATAAALIASRLQSGVSVCMIASHLSAEPGHGAALAALGLEPLLDWNMRLGEGTGALVALPLLDSAAALLSGVASLSELGVARED